MKSINELTILISKMNTYISIKLNKTVPIKNVFKNQFD